MTNLFLFFRERPRWVLGLGLAPVLFAGGFLLHAYLSRDVSSEATRLRKDLAKVTHEYQQLKKDYAGLESDRDNVLVQTKRLIADKNRLVDLEKAHDEITKAHQKLVRKESRQQTARQKLKKEAGDTAQRLKEALARIHELESETAEKSDSIKTLERALKEKVEKAPEVKQLKTEFDQLKKQKSELEQEAKRLQGKMREGEERLRRLGDYKEKYEGLVEEKKQLIQENRKLSKGIEDAPKKFKDIAHENRTLVKETANMHYNLGVFYSENKRFDLAIGEFKKAADLNPDDPRVHYNLGYLYAEHYENHDLAREHFGRYLGLDPNDENADQVRNYLLTRETFDAKVLKS